MGRTIPSFRIALSVVGSRALLVAAVAVLILLVMCMRRSIQIELIPTRIVFLSF
jgi:hypothetical protein